MLKLRFALPALAAALFYCHASFAQAPAGAPAGSTGQCKDGTYSTAASKTGACRGHQGVKQWYSASAATPAAQTPPAATPAAKTAPAATPAPAPAAKPAPATAMTAAPAATPAPKPAKTTPTPSATAAPGGGPGQVWVNTSTKVYHCPSDRYYGKTKAGKYMSEADAKAAGYKADDGKACSN